MGNPLKNDEEILAEVALTNVNKVLVDVLRVSQGPKVLGTAATLDIPLDPGTGGRSIGSGALEIGDIILSTTPDPVSEKIRSVTNAPVSHAAVYIGGEQVVEALGEGVVLHTLEQALSDDSLAVAFRHPSLTTKQALKVRDFAGQQLGKNYDRWGIVRQALFRLDLWAMCRDKVGAEYDTCKGWVGPVNLGNGTNDRYFCSELVLAAYSNAGISLTHKPPHWASPGDIVELVLRTMLGYVGHLKIVDPG